MHPVTLRRVNCFAVAAALMAIRCGNGLTRDTPSATSSAAVQTSVCALADEPQSFDGRRVELYGCISTDGQEHSSLTDPRATCRGGGLLPVEAPALPEGQKPRANAGTIVCGTFTGTFRASNGLFERVLEIERTMSLTRRAR
jgi:hypothetical protein